MSMLKYLTLQDVELVAHALARELLKWDEPIPPFRTRFPEKLESCLATLNQSFGGRDLYPTLTDKAAVLFYLMVKNHPFQNGNKRVALTATLVFLRRNGKWLSVDAQRLYNFAVWVAESPAELKDSVLQGIRDFLTKTMVDLA